MITTANGKGVLPEDHELSLGARLNFPAARASVEGCDVVLAIGTELGESDLWGPPPSLSGALIRVDVDPLQAHANHPATVAVIGDAAPALAWLVDALGDATHAPPAALAGVRAQLDAEHRAQATPWLDWLRVLRDALSDDAIVVGDSAMCCYLGALGGFPVRRSALVPLPDRIRHARLRRPRGARREARRARPAGARAVGRRRAACSRSPSWRPPPCSASRSRSSPCSSTTDTGRSATRWWTPAMRPSASTSASPGTALARALGCVGAAVALEPAALPGAIAEAFEGTGPTLITVPEAPRA